MAKHSKSVLEATQAKRDNLGECPDCGQRSADYKWIPVKIQWITTPRPAEFVQISCRACGFYEYAPRYDEN